MTKVCPDNLCVGSCFPSQIIWKWKGWTKLPFTSVCRFCGRNAVNVFDKISNTKITITLKDK